MTSVKDELPDHLMALLGYALDALRRDLTARSARSPGAARGLRSSQLRLLALTPTAGMRLTDLAERVGMTKQALGEFANVLEEKGMLETVRAEHDRRVRILRPTAKGRRAVAASAALIREVEQDWRARLGDRQWRQLRESLLAVADLTPLDAGPGTGDERG